MGQLDVSSEHDRPRRLDDAQWVFVLLAAMLLPIMVRSSFDFGVTWDESDRHKYGQTIVEFFKGLRTRADFVEDGGHLYGGLFDTICAAIEQWVPLDRYVLRHIVNSTFGWVGLVYCGRLAGRLVGPWSGVLAMVLLASSPRYFADSMNNPKDLPFAAMSVAALYYISRISPRWPYLSLKNGMMLVVALALALNIRAGALLYLGYMGLLVLTFVAAERALTWRRLADTGSRLTAIVVGMLLLGTIFWPWAQAAPLTRPFLALVAFSKFPWTGTHVLFNGNDYNPNTGLPWYYAPWWLLISTPPVVLIGLTLSVASFKRETRLWLAALWGVALLPIVLVIVQRSTLYNGIRHLLFVYPVLIVLATAGWSSWLSAPTRPWVRTGAAVLLAAGLVNVFAFDVRSYPNQTAYFNELVGGPRGAFAKYEMDYWGNCVLESIGWSARKARRSGVRIPISGDLRPELIATNAARFHEVFVTAPAQSALFVQLLRGPVNELKQLAVRPDALYRVQTADGAVLCVVLPGPAFGQVQPLFAGQQSPSPSLGSQ